MKNKVIPLVLATALMSGCSSIVSKSEYSVAINSAPEGADFVVTNSVGQNIHKGVTPSSVTLKSSSGYFKGEVYTIKLTKNGFSPKTYTLKATLDGWYWGNILLGGLIGMIIVDPATGAMYNLPDVVNVPLDQQQASAAKNQPLTIATIDTLSSEQVARLVPIEK